MHAYFEKNISLQADEWVCSTCTYQVRVRIMHTHERDPKHNGPASNMPAGDKGMRLGGTHIEQSLVEASPVCVFKYMHVRI